MREKRTFYAVALLVCALAIGGSNILTYIRHYKGRNLIGDGQKGLKRGSNCNI